MTDHGLGLLRYNDGAGRNGDVPPEPTRIRRLRRSFLRSSPWLRYGVVLYAKSASLFDLCQSLGAVARPLTLWRRFRSTGSCESFLRGPSRDLTIYVTPQHRQQPCRRVHRSHLLDHGGACRSLAGDLPRLHNRSQPARHSRIRRTRVLDVLRKGSYANWVSRGLVFR